MDVYSNVTCTFKVTFTVTLHRHLRFRWHLKWRNNDGHSGVYSDVIHVVFCSDNVLFRQRRFRQKSNDIVKNTGDVVKNTGDAVKNNGDVVKNNGDVVKNTGDVVKINGDAVKNTGDAVKNNGIAKAVSSNHLNSILKGQCGRSQLFFMLNPNLIEQSVWPDYAKCRHLDKI